MTVPPAALALVLHAPRSAASRASLHGVALRAPLGRVPRVSPPRHSHASWSAAAHALVDGTFLGALRSPLLHSESPALHLGLRRDCARSVQEGHVCRNRLGCSGFGDSTGRVASLRAGRAA